MDVIIYGSTDTGLRIYNAIKESMNVISFLDDDSSKWGKSIDGIRIQNPKSIQDMEYDEVYIGVLTYHMEVLKNLLEMGVQRNKINELYVNIPTFARIECLRNIRSIIDEELLTGNVAELGVFRGEFAREINMIFPDRTLYLFDTFEGFSEKDVSVEIEKNYTKQDKSGYFANTSEEYVMSLMAYPEKCVIKKGFFPDSTLGVEDTFCFVNIDADLYAPTIAGLNYFYPRMVVGGIILVHDFFSLTFHGVRDAVKEFCFAKKCTFMPIGDTLSVGIRKTE